MKMKLLASVAIAAAALTSQGASADAFSGIDDFVLGNVLVGTGNPGQVGSIFGAAFISTQTNLNGDVTAVNITDPTLGPDDAFVSSVDYGPDLITTETGISGFIGGGYVAGDPGDQTADPIITGEISGNTFAASGVDNNSDQYAITSATSSSEATGFVDYGGTVEIETYMNSCAAATPGGTTTSFCFN